MRCCFLFCCSAVVVGFDIHWVKDNKGFTYHLEEDYHDSSVGLAAPLQCTICHEFNSSNSSGGIDHYTNITVYKSHGDVIIGGLFPLQYIEKPKGNIRSGNVALVEAMAWAVDRLNHDQTILPNITIGFEIRDSFANAPFASVQALELAAKNVIGVVGPGSSKVAVHLASLLGSLSFPMVTYAATSDLLSESKRFRMFARTVPSDKFQCLAMRDLILRYNWTFVSILHSPELYGMEGAGSLRKILEEKQVYIDKFQPLKDSITVIEAKNLLLKLLKHNDTNTNRNHATVIVLFSTNSYAENVMEGARLLKETYNGDILSNVTWIASESWSGNLKILNMLNTSRLGSFIGLQIKTFPLPDFVKHFREIKPQSTANPWFEYYYNDTYCGGNVSNCQKNVYDQGAYEEPVVLAVEALAKTLHRLLEEHGYQFKRDANLDECIKAADPITNTGDLYYLRNSGVGSCVFKDMISQPFHAMTRPKIIFDNQTGDFAAIYTFIAIAREYYNVSKHSNIMKGSLKEIGEWTNNVINLDPKLEMLPFALGKPYDSRCSYDCIAGERRVLGSIPCCWSCIPCSEGSVSNGTNFDNCVRCGVAKKSINNNTECEDIPHTFLKPSHPAAIVLILISAIGAAATIFTIVVFIKFNETPLVKASSKELCIVMLCGILTGFISPLFSIGKPSDEMCLMRLVVGNLFGTLTIIPIFLKIARVYSLFFQSRKSTGRAPKYLLPMWQSMICLLLIFVQAMIIIFVIIWYPLRRTFYYPDDRTVLVVCAGDTGSETAIAMCVPFAYILCFMVLSTILSYQVRKLPSNFQEAKYICLAQSIALIVLIAFIPAYYVTGGVWSIFCASIATEICAAAMLILIFSKKMEIVLFYPERNKVIIDKDKLRSADMTRSERRKSFLVSQNCHMCGHSLAGSTTQKGLLAAANVFSPAITLTASESTVDQSSTQLTTVAHSQQLTTVTDNTSSDDNKTSDTEHNDSTFELKINSGEGNNYLNPSQATYTKHAH